MTKSSSLPKRPRSSARWVFDQYLAKDGWRWRLWSRNGRIVAESGEAYNARLSCRKQATKLADELYKGADVFDGGELVYRHVAL